LADTNLKIPSLTSTPYSVHGDNNYSVTGTLAPSMSVDVCVCGQHTIKGILSRSGVDVDAVRMDAATSRRKYADKVYSHSKCFVCTKNVVEYSIQRATKGLLIDEISSRHDLTKDQVRAVYKFAGMCYADLGRSAIVKTVELFRDVTCLQHDDDYRKCIHACTKCEDHFEGSMVEIDHETEFRIILLAFLDAHVPDWCEPPDANTMKVNKSYGWKDKLSKAAAYHTTETEQSYWQRVKNDAIDRWSSEGLADKFSQFHDSVAKLNTLCKTCHAGKTRGYNGGYTQAVYVASLGASKKRKRDEECDNDQKMHEAQVTQPEFVAGLVDDLKSSIASMDKEKIADALKNVPRFFGAHLPMMKTARQLLEDMQVWNNGSIDVSLPVLRVDPFAERRYTIRWPTSTGEVSAS